MYTVASLEGDAACWSHCDPDMSHVSRSLCAREHRDPRHVSSSLYPLLSLFFFCTLRDKRLPWIDACFCLRANRKLASGRPTDAFVNMCLHILLLFFACTSI